MNKLSRKQKREMKALQNTPQIPVDVEVKSIFSALSNNSNLNLSLFEQLMKVVSQDSQLAQIVNSNSTVATCVDIIAMKVATFPLNLYKQQTNGVFVPVRGKRHTDHNFSKPNAEDTQITLMYKVATYFLVYGYLYLVKVSDQVFAITPVRVSEVKEKGVIKEYKINLGDGKYSTVEKKYVCKVFKPNVDGGYNSTVRNVIASILLNSEIINQSTNHIKSGMMAKGLLLQDKEASSGLSSNQMKDLSRSFTEATSGDKSANTVMLPKGITYQTIQQTATDSGLIGLHGISDKTIVRAFKIPESIYNSENGASFATANIQEVNFYKNTIKPICLLIESFINYWDQLTSEKEYFRFELGDMVSAEEEKSRADRRLVDSQTATNLQNLGLYSKNEIREASGHDPIMDSQGNPIEEADINPVEMEDFEEVDDTDIEIDEETDKEEDT